MLKNHDDIRQNSFNDTTNDNQVSEEDQEIEDSISTKDKCLVLVFGIIIPSIDQGSDYYTANHLMNYEHKCRSRIVARNGKHTFRN